MFQAPQYNLTDAFRSGFTAHLIGELIILPLKRQDFTQKRDTFQEKLILFQRADDDVPGDLRIADIRDVEYGFQDPAKGIKLGSAFDWIRLAI